MHWLGKFDNKSDARKAREEAEKIFYGEFARSKRMPER